mgnify:CR=1 FL=1
MRTSSLPLVAVLLMFTAAAGLGLDLSRIWFFSTGLDFEAMDAFYERPFPFMQTLFSPAILLATEFVSLLGPRHATLYGWIYGLLAMGGQIVISSILIAFAFDRKLLLQGRESRSGFRCWLLKSVTTPVPAASLGMPPLAICVALSSVSFFGSGLVALKTHNWITHTSGALIVLGCANSIALCLLAGGFRALLAQLRGRALHVTLEQNGLRVLLVIGVAFIGASTGGPAAIEWKAAQCRGICEKLNPLIESLESYHAQHGAYPTNLADTVNISDFAAQSGISIQLGHYIGEEHINLAGARNADATIYLAADRFQCNVLIREVKRPISKSFHIYLRTNENPDWVRHTIRAY